MFLQIWLFAWDRMGPVTWMEALESPGGGRDGSFARFQYLEEGIGPVLAHELCDWINDNGYIFRVLDRPRSGCRDPARTDQPLGKPRLNSGRERSSI